MRIMWHHLFTPEGIAVTDLFENPMGLNGFEYDTAVRYLAALAVASPSVRIRPYASTHEGRLLYFLTITSEANHARLDQITGHVAFNHIADTGL